MKQSRGFTLIEIMVVLAIVAILATLAIPTKTNQINQKRIVESLAMVERYKAPIEGMFYALGAAFPVDNAEAGMPEPDKILGNYVSRVELTDGVLHVILGQKMPQSLHGQIVSLRPVYVEDSVASPISWVCGYSKVPEGMVAAGENLTNVAREMLPVRCRV